MAVGRITGPLLKANLLRDGVNLAFETDLLYLNVIDGKVGINTTPTALSPYDLGINGTTRTTDLEVTNQADIAEITIFGNTISSSNSIINLEPTGTNAVIYQAKILVDDNLRISSNIIETTVTDSDLEINTTGLGEVNINSNVLVNGNLHATGTITADGNLTLGDADTDSITFNADITSHIIPDLTETYDLGSDPTVEITPGNFGKRWRNTYAKDIFAADFTADTITVSSINVVSTQGNIYYVAENGSDSNAGEHEHDPVLTIKYALSLTSPGDTVYIYPGIYTEIFPLTIPVGVTVKGVGLRAVTVQPTVGTVDKDAFLLNGETTVEDLTVTGFRFNSGNNTGYGFRFAPSFTVTSRSPYIRNVTVLTRGSVTSASDPYGFDQNDAGKGALIDGSVANVLSREAAMLFHSCTFFTPNQETIVATNGVRIEWLNSFAYFADKGLYAYSNSGSTGFAGAGLTRLRIDNQVGTWTVGNTLSYYDTDGTTLLASGTIASIDGNYVNLTGRSLGFETITDRIPTTLYAQGDAKLSVTQKKFGTASLALDGVGDYVTHPSAPDFNFNTDNFTLECWIYRSVSGAQHNILDFRTTNTQNAPVIYIQNTNILTYYVNGANRITGTTVSTGVWHHVALSREGTSTKLFFNGAQVGSTWTDTTDYIQSPLTIGARFDGLTGNFNGYIDDVRISKGVARYTGIFTAPTAQLTGDLDTVLLLHFNGVNNSTTFLDSGITLQDLRTSAGGTASIINFADYSDFGAEIRSIGSANIYGTYGAYGDGVGVIAYLISQNFAYIGAGKLTTNDPNDRIAANEVVELNGARIYRTSVDNEGNFSVGDSFFVNQKTGDVLFNGLNTNITSASGVTFTDGVHTTTITATNIDTGNIRISGNTVESVTGDVNVVAASGAINLQNNTFITGDLDVTGDINIGGNITIGNESTDTVSFVAGITSNLVPSITATYDLGTDLLRWQSAFLSRAEIDGVVIDNNTISTTVANDDLTLTANGTGRIYIPDNNVEIDQALTVNGDTTLQGTVIEGDVTQTGNVTQTGDYTQTGNTEITGNLTVSSYAQFEKIKIDANTIEVTTTNTDLILEANGTGKISVPTNDVLIDQNLTVTGTATFGDVSATSVTADSFDTGDILIDNNSITTQLTNSDLELTANGTGKISVPTNDVLIDQNLTVTQDLTVTTGTTNLQAVGITGDITQTGDIDLTGDFTTSGLVQVTGNITATGTLEVGDISIAGHTIQVTTSGTDLDLRTTGVANIIFEDFKVTSNIIESTGVNQDIILQPQGTGSVIINSNQSLIIPVGTTADRPASGTEELGMIRYNTSLSRYEAWNGTYWIRLGGVSDVDGNTRILAESAPGANENILYFYANGNLTATIDASKLFAERFQTTGVDINGNTISALVTDTDLNLTTSGTGGVKVGNLRLRNNTIINTVSGAVTEIGKTGNGYVKITGTNGVVIPVGDTSQYPLVAETGMMRFNTFYGYVEVYTGTTWVNSAGATSGVTLAQAQDIGIVSALLFG